jgi:DNA-binding NarL/FixJ family response regulator
VNELTNRDLLVIKYIAQGFTNRQIGLAIGCKEDSVKKRVSEILYKLEASNRAHAVYKFYVGGAQWRLL